MLAGPRCYKTSLSVSLLSPTMLLFPKLRCIFLTASAVITGIEWAVGNSLNNSISVPDRPFETNTHINSHIFTCLESFGKTLARMAKNGYVLVAQLLPR